MNKKEKKELRVKETAELKIELEKLEKELVEAKIKLSKGQLNNVRHPGELRNKIAVIRTIINEKESSENQKEESNE